MSLIERQLEFLALREERDALKDQLHKVERKYHELEQRLAEEMKLIGQTSTQLNGKRLTVRITPRFSKRQDLLMADFCRALENTAWEWMVQPGVNSGVLQGAMREEIEVSGLLPEPLDKLVEQYDQIVVSVTKL
jgi:hypothetical protein